MKKTFTGWVQRSEKGDIFPRPAWDDTDKFPTLLGFPTIYKKRDKPSSWNEGDWPPVKVKITIEVMK